MTLDKVLQGIKIYLGILAFAGLPLLIFVLFMFGVFPVLGFDGSAAFARSTLQGFAPHIFLAMVIVALLIVAGAGELYAAAVAAVFVLSVVGGLFSVVGVGDGLGIGNVWSAFNRADHESRIEYVGALTEVAEQRPDYDERIALDQAEFIIRRSLAGVVGEFSEPVRVGDEWCSFISTAADIRNRWTESVVCVTDDSRVRRASFPSGTVPSVGLGFRLSEMRNVIPDLAGSDALFDEADIYGYIATVGDDQVARLVVPITDRRGLDFSQPRMPDGAVIFGVNDQGTYDEVVLDDVAPGQYPGPIAGISSAERVRESLNDLAGFLASAKPSRSDQSLQGTAEVGGDEAGAGAVIDYSDPNLGNSSEFILTRDGVPYAVTPLTSFGSASTITAYLEVRMDTVRNGEPLEATLYRLPDPEAANTSLANTIRVLYGQDLAEADRVYEITPSIAGTSRITIGREDQVRFVARSETEILDGELVGEICIESRSGVPLNCSPLNADPRPLGTLVFNSTPATVAAGAIGDSGDGALADVPLEDLLAEIERRVNEAGG